jgi:hypothetical protein
VGEETSPGLYTARHLTRWYALFQEFKFPTLSKNNSWKYDRTRKYATIKLALVYQSGPDPDLACFGKPDPSATFEGTELKKINRKTHPLFFLMQNRSLNIWIRNTNKKDGQSKKSEELN